MLARLRTVMRARTSIIVSHRISTVRDADQILVLEEGRIVERGSHDELIRLERSVRGAAPKATAGGGVGGVMTRPRPRLRRLGPEPVGDSPEPPRTPRRQLVLRQSGGGKAIRRELPARRRGAREGVRRAADAPSADVPLAVLASGGGRVHRDCRQRPGEPRAAVSHQDRHRPPHRHRSTRRSEPSGGDLSRSFWSSRSRPSTSRRGRCS